MTAKSTPKRKGRHAGFQIQIVREQRDAVLRMQGSEDRTAHRNTLSSNITDGPESR
jgi:hypothetical protein